MVTERARVDCDLQSRLLLQTSPLRTPTSCVICFTLRLVINTTHPSEELVSPLYSFRAFEEANQIPKSPSPPAHPLFYFARQTTSEEIPTTPKITEWPTPTIAGSNPFASYSRQHLTLVPLPLGWKPICFSTNSTWSARNQSTPPAIVHTPQNL